VRKGLAIVAAAVLGLLGLLLLVVMLNVTGLPLCSDREAVGAADECIEASSGERAFGVVAGWASVLSAALALLFVVRYARRGTGGGRLALTAALAPVLALLAAAFLPVSF
jgi:drug/metabolite transporter (DMT)-like permease